MLCRKYTAKVLCENVTVIFCWLYEVYIVKILSYQISTCLEQLVAVILPAIKIAPRLSTFIIAGSLTAVFMIFNNWITNITSFAALDSTTHSAPQLDRVMLLCAFDVKIITLVKRFSSKMCLQMGHVSIYDFAGEEAHKAFYLTNENKMVCLQKFLMLSVCK